MERKRQAGRAPFLRRDPENFSKGAFFGGSMSKGFIKTGQTLMGAEGTRPTPEQHRRGLWGLSASLAILLLGGAFMAYAVLSTPAPAPRPEGGEALQDPSLVATPAATAPIDAVPLFGSAALPADRHPAQEPRPKSARVQSPGAQPGEGDFAPRLKPAPDGASSAAPMVRAVRLGDAFLAGVEDGPPPVFFAVDIQYRDDKRADPLLVYAGDLDRPNDEMRIRIAKGENFVDALARAGILAEDRNAAAYAFGRHYDLRRLLPGQEISLTRAWPHQTVYELAAFGAEPDARLVSLEFRADPETRIHVRRDENAGFVGEKAPVALSTRILSFAGRIEGSLYLSAKGAGAPDQIIADFADAFAYDVDFQREILGGDEFEAVFEARYDDKGALVSTGNILFARLAWRGRSKEKRYYRFDDDEDGRADFFDATGQSAKRLLMKTPIDGARLSSGFGTRKHPILGYARAHKGVDFAAPRGTPIKAAGDGVVERANWYGSFGNYVRIRHANGYKTAYAHLRGFASGMRAGKRVRQGDVIGYVGTTGSSTGPHLHYEVHLQGDAVNPMRLKIATGKTLAGAALDRFQAERQLIDAMRLPEEDAAPLYAKEADRGESAL
jgi:murein DD-endopeptidase MepM/ murein hydrolase activator NlpD